MYGLQEYVFSLKCEVKSLRAQVESFRSGKKYKKMREGERARIAEKDLEIRRLKLDVENAHAETARVRGYWLQGVDDLEREHAAALRKAERNLKEMEERAIRAERQRDEALDKLTEMRHEKYRVETRLEEECGKNQKLLAQINRDYENSSIPSSLKPNHKPISNNREKSGLKPGGQPGHAHHGRKKLLATKVTAIPAPDKYAHSPDYTTTGRTVTKQLVSLLVNVFVHEYATPEFRSVKTGQRVHAEFPPGVVNDVNYDGSVKAFAFLLNNRCCVSIDKVTGFLSDLTDGALSLSKGMVSGLCKEFSGKTKAGQDKAFGALILSPVMSADFTAARVGGQSASVTVCATPESAMYFARDAKGHKGVEKTPAEDYQGILVHDHDKTFYKYGGGHQECLAHVLRYLKDSIQNEPGLRWNKMMRGLIQEMIHYRNSLDPDEDADYAAVAVFEKRYDEILNVARDEYEYEPPSDYFRDGYNLAGRLRKYKGCHLLFLHDRRVPSDNNLSERLLRNFKRKQKQMMTFRSFESLDCTCRCMGMLVGMSALGQNLYKTVTDIFN